MMKFNIKRVGVKLPQKKIIKLKFRALALRQSDDMQVPFFWGSNSFLAMPSSKKPYKDKTARFSTQLI